MRWMNRNQSRIEIQSPERRMISRAHGRILRWSSSFSLSRRADTLKRELQRVREEISPAPSAGRDKKRDEESLVMKSFSTKSVKKRSRAVRRLLFAVFMGGLSCRADALQWEAGAGYRRAKLPPLASTKTGFTLLPGSMTGVVFTNSLSEERIMANANLLNGSGVALGDYDGDGLCDIYLCDLGGTNVLYRNLGSWRFQDVTREAGVSCASQASTGAVFADINGDGWLDLLVTSMGGPNACFLNDGHGRFTNVTAAAGLVSRLGNTSMALADVDGDGSLDLYVANYGVTSILRSGGALNVTTEPGRQPVVRGR